MEGKSHGDARIKNLSEVHKERLQRRLSSWLDEDVDLGVLEDK